LRGPQIRKKAEKVKGNFGETKNVRENSVELDSSPTLWRT